MDLVEGKKGCDDPYLLILTERKTRIEIIEKIPDKTQDAVIKGLDMIERRMGLIVVGSAVVMRMQTGLSEDFSQKLSLLKESVEI